MAGTMAAVDGAAMDTGTMAAADGAGEGGMDRAMEAVYGSGLAGARGGGLLPIGVFPTLTLQLLRTMQLRR